MNEEQAFTYLTSRGFAPHQAAGILGNLAQESGLNPRAVGDGGAAVGLAQWRGPRRAALMDFATKSNRDPNAMETQLDFLVDELQGSERRALDSLVSAKTPEEAAIAFSRDYERPGKPNNERRVGLAQRFMNSVIPAAQADEIPPLPEWAEEITDDQPITNSQHQASGGGGELPPLPEWAEEITDDPIPAQPTQEKGWLSNALERMGTRAARLGVNILSAVPGAENEPELQKAKAEIEARANAAGVEGVDAQIPMMPRAGENPQDYAARLQTPEGIETSINTALALGGSAALPAPAHWGTKQTVRGGTPKPTAPPSGASELGREPLPRAANKTAYAREGERLIRETGIELTPGAVTGGRFQTATENLARQNAFTADKAAMADQKIAEQAIRRIEVLMNKTGAREASAETVGHKIMNAIRTAGKEIDDIRERTAAQDYGKVRQLAGNKPFFRYDNTVNELKRIIAEHENVIGDDAARIVMQAKAALGKLQRTGEAGKPGLIVDTAGKPLFQAQEAQQVLGTIDDAMKNRRFWSSASRGAGNVFKDVAPNKDREIAARLTKAINADFEAAGNIPGELGAALQKANNNYRAFSQSIEFVEKSPLGRMLGKELVDAAYSGEALTTTAAEKFAEKFVRMTPSELRVSKEILERHSPEALKSVKRYVLQRALEKGMDVAPSAGANAPRLNPGGFIKGLLNDRAMRTLYSPKEIKEISDVVQALRRWGDKFGYNFSGTASQLDLVGAIHSAVTWSLHGVGAIGTKYAFLRSVAKSMNNPAAGAPIAARGADWIADAMSSPEGRNAIKTVLTLPARSKKFQQAAKYLAVRMGTAPESDEQQEGYGNAR